MKKKLKSMKDKIIDFFFEEDEKELVEEYSKLLKVFAVSTLITMILIMV